VPAQVEEVFYLRFAHFGWGLRSKEVDLMIYFLDISSYLYFYSARSQLFRSVQRRTKNIAIVCILLVFCSTKSLQEQFLFLFHRTKPLFI
jgi:hypothetical protein